MVHDSILIVSFGGPEGMDDVMPFLENVLRGKNVPRERMLEVAHHYERFGGVSPINQQCRDLIAALKTELDEKGPNLPIYWGNRNWHPMLAETLAKMRDDGVRRALAFFTSAYSSYSGCRQYREDIIKARSEVGEGAPEIDKIRVFYNHPGFVDPNVEMVRNAFAQIPPERLPKTRLLFTAHSIPSGMAEHCHYEVQLRETCRLVAEALPWERWDLVYQSRSGPPSQPWLEPDVCDVLADLGKAGVTDVVVSPIGFISDHLEVLYDLDTEAKELCQAIALNMVRADTVGNHPTFISMIRELILERMSDHPVRRALGNRGPNHDVCPDDCCLYAPRRPASSPPSGAR